MSGTNAADRLYTLRYKSGDEPHLRIRDQKLCIGCTVEACLSVCPADVYERSPGAGEMLLAYENCVECGTCRIVCPSDNIDWNYPLGGLGVVYKYG